MESIESTHQPSPTKSRRRKKKNKSDNRELSPFLPDILIGSLMLVGIACMLSARFVPAVVASSVPIIGGGILVFALILGIRRGRQRLFESQSLWGSTGCPQCGHEDLKRTSRVWYQRLITTLGIPVANYLCKECDWRGSRLNDYYF